MMKSLCIGSLMLMLAGCGGQASSEEKSLESRASALATKANTYSWGNGIQCSITGVLENNTNMVGLWVSWNLGRLLGPQEPGYNGFRIFADCIGNLGPPLVQRCGIGGDPTPCYVDLAPLNCSPKKSTYLYTTFDHPDLISIDGHCQANKYTVLRTKAPGYNSWISEGPFVGY